MRHGNRREKFWIAFLISSFRSYLWGMETKIIYGGEIKGTGFDPTYEAWKLGFYLLFWIACFLFRSYLWGMETGVSFIVSTASAIVSILPMRHGNKPFRIISIITATVSILPMRHGNDQAFGRQESLFCVFRSYLWGMETVIISYNKLILCTPFRSYLWGMETRPAEISIFWAAWFRSYLWGMETRFPRPDKLSLFAFRSYLWGMETELALQMFRLFSLVSILPMRHGNQAEISRWWRDIHNVSILPTRHGNHLITEYIRRNLELFRSYLRGMETKTSPSSHTRFIHISILPTRHGNEFSR